MALSALRDPAADVFTAVTDAFKAGDPLVINLLYGDFEGGQRVITQITVRHANERWLAQATRHSTWTGPIPAEASAVHATRCERAARY
jgi:hypothetical protein